MSRLHADPIEVQRRDDEPAQFLWHNRLYVVREVLARWTESGGWWLTGAMSALASGDASDVSGTADTSDTSDVIPVHPGQTADALVRQVGVDDGERDWWRVVAAAGATAGSGVYDVCFDWSRGAWSLARVLD